MEDAPKRPRFPQFGNWECYDDLSMTQYFESTSQTGLKRQDAAGSGSRVGRGRNPYYPPPVPHCYYYGVDSEGALFKVPVLAPVVLTDYPWKTTKEASANKRTKQYRHQRQQHLKREQRKQGKVYDYDVTVQLPARPPRPPKAVDEDLYKIPPELLRRKLGKKKILNGDFWSRCLGLNCVI
ncbi:unnamed protein product [Spirodela intermedia]|uniref:Uncharacterized protein n=1 Tax=Spirodela intermedia TaxID=51605 RepID=A0A7I8L5R7_SPIIN|nr:unnamed protein product [Spirodela intermedia]